ncbi:UPF0489 family protein [Ramlibacter algicola]|uniref:UPF0489 family protein n=1 Tax=Ramlibacter algicola TaxID=2795217 RepID=A0A934Q6C6_9BURK|nr:UPF0489 family protein [Ramlibacter algicola]MBK0394992.1 UPF0489 family protein [Ramlibacter algicola]
MGVATVFEEHASVLPHWLAQGAQGATLVSLDAHLDLQFVEPARIDRLRHARTPEAWRALQAAHPLDPDRRACFGIEDFLHPAAQLGLVRHLVWVAPPHVLRDGAMGALGALAQMEGVTPEQLESFSMGRGGWLQGRLLGLDIVAGTLAQLQGLPIEGPLLLDIDADYFVAVPGDTLWCDPLAACRQLRDWLGPARPLTVARSVGTGFLPLRHRFIADLVAAAWDERADLPHWSRLAAAERDPAQREALLRAELAGHPDCAATLHALSLACGDPAEAQRLQVAAAGRDAAYADDPLRTLGAARARGVRVPAAERVALERIVAAQPPSPERRAAWVALGLLQAGEGRLQDALHCDQQSRQGPAGHPDLALAIARLCLATGDAPRAAPWLARAAEDDETRVQAWLLLCGAALQKGDAVAALAWAERAHQAAPAWPLPLQWMEQAARRAGRAAAAHQAQADRSQLLHRLDAVARRLAIPA